MYAGKLDIFGPLDSRGLPHRKPYHTSGLILLASCPKTISTVGGIVGGIIVYSDGSNAVSATLYDGNGGKEIFKAEIAGEEKMGGILLDVEYINGLYLTMSGTGSKAIVYYADSVYP